MQITCTLNCKTCWFSSYRVHDTYKIPKRQYKLLVQARLTRVLNNVANAPVIKRNIM